MPLANGRSYLAIPGPSAMPERVLNAMHRAAPNIYEGALIDMVAGIVPDLRKVMRTEHHVAMYIGNGHAMWEAAVGNTLEAGDHVLVPATGFFANGWADVADAHGVHCEIMDFGVRGPIDPAKVEERLRADKEHKIKAVMTVQVDTGTSVRNDVPALRAALDAAGHPALLMIDCIASTGCDRFEMDAWGVDVAITGSQKGLMVPPGMGFVFFNDKADAVRGTRERTSRYWDWRPRAKPDIPSHYWNGTAPTHHLYGLREALDMIGEEGIENIWDRHATLARAYWAAVETWNVDGGLSFNIADPDYRSHAVTALSLPAPKATELRTWLVENTGVTLGIGLGMAAPGTPEWHGYFRIGHMGHVNAHMVLGVVGAIEAGLEALGIPHNAGGASAAAKVVAGG